MFRGRKHFVIFVLFILLFPCFSFSDNYQTQSAISNTQNNDAKIIYTSAEHDSHGEKKELEPIHWVWAVPFVILLFCIATIPLFAPYFWHHNYWKLSIFVFAIPMLIVDLGLLNDQVRVSALHEIEAYITFILLLASLFTISGAINLKGTLVGKPLLNTIILTIGTLLASFMATTGASMLLIRPLIRANKFRKNKTHIIIFFIFTVSNMGGLLTPLGDPPLFLGYLKGVPFTWTLFNLPIEWFIANTILITIFFIWDTRSFNNEIKNGTINLDALKDEKPEPLKIQGFIQLLFLAGVVLSIYFQGTLAQEYSWWPHFGPQEGVMLLMMLCSLAVAGTNSQIRQANEFSWFPIKEVASLFAGIFACMVPALYLLNIYGPQLPLEEPFHFFWVTGSLSSYLDNAPTYVVLLELAKAKLCSLSGGVCANLSDVEIVRQVVVKQHDLLAAISCGAVFMGANTYIGNAPNFMVKAIAEESGISMPSFFGYMFYSASVLIPIYVIITFLFFSPF